MMMKQPGSPLRDIDKDGPAAAGYEHGAQDGAPGDVVVPAVQPGLLSAAVAGHKRLRETANPGGAAGSSSSPERQVKPKTNLGAQLASLQQALAEQKELEQKLEQQELEQQQLHQQQQQQALKYQQKLQLLQKLQLPYHHQQQQQQGLQEQQEGLQQQREAYPPGIAPDDSFSEDNKHEGFIPFGSPSRIQAVYSRSMWALNQAFDSKRKPSAADDDVQRLLAVQSMLPELLAAESKQVIALSLEQQRQQYAAGIVDNKPQQDDAELGTMFSRAMYGFVPKEESIWTDSCNHVIALADEGIPARRIDKAGPCSDPGMSRWVGVTSNIPLGAKCQSAKPQSEKIMLALPRDGVIEKFTGFTTCCKDLTRFQVEINGIHPPAGPCSVQVTAYVEPTGRDTVAKDRAAGQRLVLIMRGAVLAWVYKGCLERDDWGLLHQLFQGTPSQQHRERAVLESALRKVKL